MGVRRHGSLNPRIRTCIYHVTDPDARPGATQLSYIANVRTSPSPGTSRAFVFSDSQLNIVVADPRPPRVSTARVGARAAIPTITP